jgi:hypothetical protein
MATLTTDDLVEIRDLACRYAVAIDSRNLDMLVGLYSRNVDTLSPHGIGRGAMEAYFAAGLKTIGRSAHHVTTTTAEHTGEDTAAGWAYALANEERFDPPHWAMLSLAYHDDYVREEGRWRFARRRHIHTFWTDRIGHPDDPSGFARHPEIGTQHRLPWAWPTWRPFWGGAAPGQDDAPLDNV